MEVFTKIHGRVLAAPLMAALSATLIAGVFSTPAFAVTTDSPSSTQSLDTPDPASPKESDPGSPSEAGSPPETTTPSDEPSATDQSGSSSEPSTPANQTVNVTLNANGGTVNKLATWQLVLTTGQPVSGLPTAVGANRIFLGWFTDPVNGVALANGTVLTATDDFTLFAHWKLTRHYAFNGNGGTVKPAAKDVPVGTALGALPTPSRVPYIFKGWFTAKSGGTKVTASTVAPQTSGTTTLYAQWTPGTRYTFNPNGGTVAVKTKTVALGAKIGALPNPSRGGYVFKGWYTAKSGGTKVTASTKSPKKLGQKTVYARWAPATTYTFNANGGSVGTKSKTVAANAKAGSLPSPTRAFYSFMGWHTKKAQGGTLVTSSTKTSKKSAKVTLYAHWAPVAMYQFDSRWSTKRYSVGSFKDNGCGPSAMSIVVRALARNTSVTPWTAAQWSEAHGYEYTTAIAGRTDPKFFIDYPAAFGITVTAVPGGNSAAAKAAALAAVKRGDWVVAFMSPGNWAVHGHYIVWYDVDGSKALVRDPVSVSPTRTAGQISLLQKQAWGYYIVHVPANQRIWA